MFIICFPFTSSSQQIRAHALGWVGLGFSPNGAMTGADIYLGWVKPDGGVVVYVGFYNKFTIAFDCFWLPDFINLKFYKSKIQLKQVGKHESICLPCFKATVYNFGWKFILHK